MGGATVIRTIRVLAAALLAGAVVGCSVPAARQPASEASPPEAEQPSKPDAADSDDAATTGIYAVELEDVVSGEMFTLADLRGKPVLLHPFAMW
jgi:cytochrome oxidase Cu insertion factor (SCO1/SenC/PrrC family)